MANRLAKTITGHISDYRFGMVYSDAPDLDPDPDPAGYPVKF